MKVARNLVGDDKIDSDTEPVTGGEDFSFYLEKFEGAFGYIGV